MALKIQLVGLVDSAYLKKKKKIAPLRWFLCVREKDERQRGERSERRVVCACVRETRRAEITYTRSTR